jgi:hypothetical protein
MPKENRNPPAKAGAPAVAMLEQNKAANAELNRKLDAILGMLADVLDLVTPPLEVDDSTDDAKGKKK